MKTFKKLAALLLAVIMVLGMAIPTMAANEGTIKVTGLAEGDTVTVYQVATINEKGEVVPVAGTGVEATWFENPTQEGIFGLVGKGTLIEEDGAVTKNGDNYEYTKSVDPGVYVAKATAADSKVIYNPVILATYQNTEGMKVGQVDISDNYSDKAEAKKTDTTGWKEIADKTDVVADSTGGSDAAQDDTNGDEEEEGNIGFTAGAGKKTADMGKPVDYRIFVNMPEYPTNAKDKSLWVKDTLINGLDYVDMDKITVNGVEIDEEGKFIDADGNYIARLIYDEENSPRTFTIVFDYDVLKATGASTIDVRYWAALNDECAIGRFPNTNEMEYGYSKDTTKGETWDIDEDEPKDGGDYGTVNDKERLYTYKVALIKIDEENPEDTLAGAEFKLCRDAEGTDDIATGLTTNENGVVVYEGGTLAAGTYYFIETKAPTGYTLNETVAPVEANWVKAVYKTTETSYTSEKPSDDAVQAGWLKDGVFYALDEKPEGVDVAPETADDPDQEVFPAYEVESATDLVVVENPNEAEPAGIAAIKFANTKVAELPSTGGMGTYIFTALGIAIMAVAASLLVFKKRRA